MSAPARTLRFDALTGPQKSAVLCLALGPDHGAKLLQALSPEEQEAVTREIAALEKRMRTEPQLNRRLELRRQVTERTTVLSELTEPLQSTKD